MDVFRSVLLVIHLATLVGLSVGLVALAAGVAPAVLSRAVVAAAALMGLSGAALIGVRSALDLDVDPLKLTVKALVLAGVLVLARRLTVGDGSVGGRPRRTAGGIGGLLIVDTVIAFAWT